MRFLKTWSTSPETCRICGRIYVPAVGACGLADVPFDFARHASGACCATASRFHAFVCSVSNNFFDSFTTMRANGNVKCRINTTANIHETVNECKGLQHEVTSHINVGHTYTGSNMNSTANPKSDQLRKPQCRCGSLHINDAASASCVHVRSRHTHISTAGTL